MRCSTSSPCTTCPMTTCLPSHCGAAASVMKNCDVLLFLPELAMETTPGPSCLSFNADFSSLNLPPYMLSPPLPSPAVGTWLQSLTICQVTVPVVELAALTYDDVACLCHKPTHYPVELDTLRSVGFPSANCKQVSSTLLPTSGDAGADLVVQCFATRLADARFTSTEAEEVLDSLGSL